MTKARNRVLLSALLLLVGLGAAIYVAFQPAVAGWNVLLAYVAGGGCAWYLFGALVGYVQARTKQQLAAGAVSGVLEGIKRWAAQQQAANAAAAPDEPAANTAEGEPK